MLVCAGVLVCVCVCWCMLGGVCVVCGVWCDGCVMVMVVVVMVCGEGGVRGDAEAVLQPWVKSARCDGHFFFFIFDKGQRNAGTTCKGQWIFE